VTDAPQEAPTAEGREARRPHVGVVGIGASAGGLEALERLFTHMPATTGLAFVVVQHLSPDHKSLMVELLSKHTAMPVRRVEDEMTVEPDTVYLLPPKRTVVIQGDRLKLSDRPPGHAVPLPVDIFFSSLAEARGEAATGIILSGTGSDGARGVADIKAAGGTVLVQDESTAKFDGMPRAAISTGLVDAVLAPEAMPAHLVLLSRQSASAGLDPADEVVVDAYPRVIELLRRHTAVDFTHYKATSVLRRVERRMGVTGSATLAQYAEVLAESPREVTTLFKELLIGVTRFFRDPEAFEAIRARALPSILEAGRWDQQVRVWVAGCSTGEEAYGLGILFLEAMEAAGRRLPLKIFATDIDRDALEHASAGVYPESIAADVSPERLNRWFVKRGEHYVVGRELRSLVLFAAHNLVKDPPFTRMDLISCRNLLIYLEPVLQRKVLSLFHYSLGQGRFLMIGPSETIGDAGEQFQGLDTKWKLYQALGTPRASLGDTLSFGSTLERRRRPAAPPPDGAVPPGDTTEAAYRWLVGEFAPVALLVTPSCDLVHVFGDATRLLTVPAGRASLNVTDMLERTLGAAVSTAVHQAHAQQREIRYTGVATGPERGLDAVDLRVVPLPSGRHERGNLLVVFQEARRDARPLPAGESLDRATEQRLADLSAELQYTKENLQATIEELETSNEELQATNEELLSSNEELQSTNEELQSVNEELHTVNQEYQAKIQELSDLNADLDNLLRGTEIGTIFLDEGLTIRRFTPAVAGLVRIIPRDVGRSIEHFSFAFDAPGFLEALLATLADGQHRSLDAAAADGRRLQVRVLPYLGGSIPQRGVVVTFVDVTEAVRQAERLQAIIDSLAPQIAVLDREGRIVLVNRAWRRFAEENGAGGLASVEVGADYLATCATADGPDREAAEHVATGLRRVLAGKLAGFSYEYPCHAPAEERWFKLQASPLPDSLGGLVVAHVDITARHRAERALEAARAR
jgi:two-component system CheB/CheR fusion protein